MPRLTHDDPRLVYACPACDHGGSTYKRTGPNTSAGDPDDPFLCEKCGHTFEEPVERPAKQRKQGGGKSRLERILDGDTGTTVHCGECDEPRAFDEERHELVGTTFDCPWCGASNIVPTPEAAA